MSASAAFAPHTRGSTLPPLRIPRREIVCPAHAGVYLEPGIRHRETGGLPRTHGGLPQEIGTEAAFYTFAPHTRGSTHYFVGLASRCLVCPAHAGVYRESAYRPSLPRRLPRTRGGLPWWVTVSSNERWFAPHTRGSTCSVPGCQCQPHVCPAHAGVYRFRRCPNRFPAGLPRTRGGLPHHDVSFSS